MSKDTPDVPAENPAVVPEASAPEAPAEAPVESVQVPVTEASAEAPAPSTESAPPKGDKKGDAVAEEKTRLAVLAEKIAADAGKLARDLTREEEAALPNAGTDGSNIGVQTAGDVTANLPKNDNGQVEIDENGRVVGT